MYEAIAALVLYQGLAISNLVRISFEESTFPVLDRALNVYSPGGKFSYVIALTALQLLQSLLYPSKKY